MSGESVYHNSIVKRTARRVNAHNPALINKQMSRRVHDYVMPEKFNRKDRPYNKKS